MPMPADSGEVDELNISGGRRRTSNTTTRTYSAEDQALNHITKQAEQRLAAKRAARAEAREIRMRELEKQQKDNEDKQDHHYDLVSQHRQSSIRQLSSTTSYASSRRSSEDSVENDTARDYKHQLHELEDKYKKAMMTTAQLDNEKQMLKYQVDLLKDTLEENEETLTEVQRQYKDKCRELDLQKRNFNDLERDVKFLKEQIAHRDKLIEEHGLVLIGTESGDSTNTNSVINGAVLLGPDTVQMLEQCGDGTLDERLKKFAEEKDELVQEVKRLREELDDEKMKRSLTGHTSPLDSPKMNGPSVDDKIMEVQKEASKQVGDYKFKLQKAEQEIVICEANVSRLEHQVKRYKTSTEESEKLEEELKVEKRKLARELREAQARIEELQTQNNHLQKRMDKMKSNRNALLK